MKFIVLLLFFIQPFIGAQEEVCTPQSTLQKLMEGNQRYVQDRLLHPDRTQDRRDAVAATQSPCAAILGCSDSRVSPEIVFDQGIGDLFVVRVAGNVLGPLELDSVDYAAIYLKSKLIMVLGHENCGAVKAVLNDQTKDIENVAQLISPVLIPEIKKSPNALEEAIKANVRQVVDQLRRSPVVKMLIDEKKINVVGAYYNLVSGKVDLLDHPILGEKKMEKR